MRRFLLIFACVFSFCVRSDTNIVYLSDSQYLAIMNRLNSILNVYDGNAYESYRFYINSDGSLSDDIEYITFPEYYISLSDNMKSILEFLHLLSTGSSSGSYNTSSNNILAYASSLRDHNSDVRELLENIEDNTLAISTHMGGLSPWLNSVLNSINIFHSDYTDNFDRLYDVLTNIDFNVSISNQIDLLQVMNGSISNNFDNISNILSEINKNISDETRPLLTRLNDLQAFLFSINDKTYEIHDSLNNNHSELMDFLYGLTNSALFASNLLNCCCGDGSYTNIYDDAVIAMLQWMTNNWGFTHEFGPADTNSWKNSNSVWWVWRPDDDTWSKLLIPALEWRSDFETGGHHPYYLPKGDQYDRYFLEISHQYNNLLEGLETGDVNGQEFLTGLVDLQLHILANMSTQIYMLNDRLPSKTNLWDWIESYKQEVQDSVRQAEDENSQMVESVKGMLDYSPFSMVGNHFPKVSNALKSLKVEEGASPVVRIPIPRALRVSDSDELVVDVRESSWWSSGRTWCRWIFTFVWGWLFIRIGLVPILYIFFYTLRIAEISAHLVLMGSVRGSSGVVSSLGASAVDLALSLIGIDTDFKKFVWGIMRD